MNNENTQTQSSLANKEPATRAVARDVAKGKAEASDYGPEPVPCFELTLIPRGWNKEMDEGEYDEKLSNLISKAYETLFAILSERVIALNQMVNHSLYRYLKKDSEEGEFVRMLGWEALPHLSLPCKLELLKKMVVKHAPSAQAGKRHVAGLIYCEQVLATRQALAMKHLLYPTSVRLLELINLDREMGAALSYVHKPPECECE